MPQELYQAAELDGASTWQRFRRLTLPLLRRIILFAIVVSTIFGLQIFDTALILTNGGPGTSTVTIVFRIWKYVFGEADKVGLGAAISVALLAAILVLTLVQLRVLRGQGRGCLRWRPRSRRGARPGRLRSRRPRQARRHRHARAATPSDVRCHASHGAGLHPRRS